MGIGFSGEMCKPLLHMASPGFDRSQKRELGLNRVAPRGMASGQGNTTCRSSKPQILTQSAFVKIDLCFRCYPTTNGCEPGPNSSFRRNPIVTTLRNLAIAAVAIAGSVSLVPALAIASPGVLNRLDTLQTNNAGSSPRSGVTNPFVEDDAGRYSGVEVAGDPVSASEEESDRGDGSQSTSQGSSRRDGQSFSQYIRGLRSTSGRNTNSSPY